MADQKATEDPKAKSKSDKNEEGKPQAPKAPAAPLLPVIILAAAVIAGVVCSFVLVSALAPKPEAPAAGSQKQEKKEVKAKAESKTEGKKEGKKEGKQEAAENLFVFDKPIVVNLAETNAERFLKISVVLEMESAALRPEVESKQPKFLDLLINILSSKTLDTISTPAGRNMLRQEMIDKVNALLESGRLVNIYFTEFVIQ